MKVSEPFEALVDRSGEHHLWTGAINPVRRTGRLKVDGRQVTAHRLAWELAHGALPESARVLACPDEPACVRVEHLRVDHAADQVDRSTRRPGRVQAIGVVVPSSPTSAAIR